MYNPIVRTSRKGSLTWYTALALFIAFAMLAASLSVAVSSVLAQDTKVIVSKHANVAAPDCEPGQNVLWHFIINQLKEGEAPTSITVEFSNQGEVTVPVRDHPSATAHYDVITGPNETMLSAWTTIYFEWDGNFNLSSVDCNGEPTQPELHPLTASKTATGTFNRTISWSLEKSVDPASHSGTIGSVAGSSDWTVTATKTVTDSDFQVTGTITINNPNDIVVHFAVDDVLNDGTVADVICPYLHVEPNSSTSCDYIADPPDDEATLNTATITSETAGVGGTMATAPINWTPTVSGDNEVTLGDVRFDHSEVISSTTTRIFPETFACPADPNEYTDGVHQRTETNIATLIGDHTELNAQASVDITCTLLPGLQVEKTAHGTFDRTISWTLEKSVDPGSHTGVAGEDAGDSDWTVVATKSETDTNFEVTGEITITNPNDIPVSFSITDTLNDANNTVARVGCPGTGDNTGTVPANDSVVCHYLASPEDDSATENRAVVTSETLGVEGATATASVSFTANVIGDDEVTLADERFNFSQSISESTTEIFPETFACPADPNEYTDGVHQRTETNVATLTGQHTDLTAQASVNIICILPEPDQGRIIVTKITNPFGSSDEFGFTATWGDFTLTGEVGNNTHNSGLLDPNQTYTVTELGPDGDWELSAIVCVGGDNVSVAGNTATIDLGMGETVVCTFFNVLDVDVTIVPPPPPPPTVVTPPVDVTLPIEEVPPPIEEVPPPAPIEEVPPPVEEVPPPAPVEEVPPEEEVPPPAPALPPVDETLPVEDVTAPAVDKPKPVVKPTPPVVAPAKPAPPIPKALPVAGGGPMHDGGSKLPLWALVLLGITSIAGAAAVQIRRRMQAIRI